MILNKKTKTYSLVEKDRTVVDKYSFKTKTGEHEYEILFTVVNNNEVQMDLMYNGMPFHVPLLKEFKEFIENLIEELEKND